ncbi:MAG: toluene tolerance protein [Phycisphaerales bacterium JB063]
MKALTLPEYEALTAGAETYSEDRYGPKVYALADGTVLKLFRHKRLLSSSRVWPYAKRFAYAARVLAKRKIPCVHVTRVARAPHLKRDLVVYTYLEGETLRDKLVAAMAQDDTAARDALLEHHARFLAELHQKRIYFRAVHFNNVIVCPDGQLGLIDISEVWPFPFPLNPIQRARNLRPMLKYDEDRAALAAHGLDRFVQNYLAHARLTPPSKLLFKAWVAGFHRAKA